MLNHNELPSLDWVDVCRLIHYIITAIPRIEIPDITIQQHANYQSVQRHKEVLKYRESKQKNFKDEYEARRINITYLFGARLRQKIN